LRDELDSRAAQRDEATARLADLKAQLELRQQRQTELEAERKGLQADVQKHREEFRSQAEATKADLVRHASELDRVRRESQGQIEQLRADYAKSRDSQVQVLQQQLDELRAKLTDSEAAAGRFQRELEQQLDAARKSGREGLPAGPELAALRDENKQLEAWLAEAEAKAKTTGSGGGQEMDDLRRRFEMAVQDVRELKTKNVELTEQLAKAGQHSGGASAAGVSSGGWESLKKKLLADLETDFDEEDGAEKADKLTVHGAIKITDQVVAEKEREIEELRSLLQSQTQQVGDVAVGAAAVAQMLDTDELIRQEREALKRLQDSLREQLRQAEVDISVERAKLARERAEVDEKIRGIEAEKANMPAVGSEHVGEKGKKPGGRKWLTRLGLGDGKDE
jgi:chromosome segregation ATPase